ncbi:uncharacterized protein E0L32_002100 [Thyridium curvatum]|uniref:Uncharacterized protein n=1 Tax=Thyridium curvatum TaxID=1093900 RepID=A0A507AKH3_9PEZI|nr:uncharacterized protein E0L32_002033 [Thyridium curvatum]XP_030989208.1 uncharacterized protein E0L32_002100 [Thyridium curvatum]TPX07430.1 hypothetical protein E0L32_002033 [Thyridium curvatum]TPX07497.1 hypothetical protein E0L32_002100 [Thyridium curvatum]
MLHHHCPDLRALYVEYPPTRRHPTGNEHANKLHNAHPTCRTLDFELFVNLTELSLLRLSGDLRLWRQKILKIILHSPNLTKLGLSIGYATTVHLGDNTSPSSEARIETGFFDDLCGDYHASGTRRLHLKTFHFGSGIPIRDAMSLGNLTDPTFLEEIIVDQGRLDVSALLQNVILREMTPRLRRLLIVNSCEHKAKKEILRLLEAGGLLPQLALYLYTGLTRDIIEFPGRQDGSVLRSRMVKVEVDGLPDGLDGIAADLDGQVPEGLCLLAILDRDPAPALESVTGFINKFSEVAQQFPKLNQVLIELSFGSETPSLSRHDLTRTAELLASNVPQLCYIHLCGVFWKVCTSLDEGPEVVELDFSDLEEIELFKMICDGLH